MRETLLLSAEVFGAILRYHPRIGHVLLANIATLTGPRLRVTSDALRFAGE